MSLKSVVVLSAVLLGLAPGAFADDIFILATGRRDPRIYAIDFKEALKPQNNNTPNAIVARSKTALDRLDGRPLGDPANIVLSEDGKTAFVVNHHGAIDNAEFTQHGGRGNIAIMDVKKMLQRKNDDTAEALDRHVDGGHFGAVGLVLLDDLFVVGNAESHLTEDGGNRVTFVDRKTGSLRGEVELLQNQSEGGKAQSRSLYGDLEKRIAALETLGGVGAPGAGPAAGSALPSAGGVAAGSEQALYDSAFNALKGADYPKAIANFRAFLTSYPTSPLASNAQYWLGEAFYVTREYDAAVQAFRKVVTDWPDSRKAPDALVKVGFTQAAQGKNAEARTTLEDVARRFPGTEAAQLASERLKRLPGR